MRKLNFAKVSIVALFVGVLTPLSAVTTAHATDPTYDKTFTVRGADGALLTGASIYLIDDGAGFQRVASTINGVATITIPTGLNNITIGVEPAESDHVNAISNDADFSEAVTNNSPQSISVNLDRANMHISLKNSDSTPTEKGIAFLYPGPRGGQQYSLTARTGAFGIALPANLTPGNQYRMNPAIFEQDIYTSKSLFSFPHGLIVAGASGSQTYTVYQNASDYTSGNVLAPNGSGVYEFEVQLGNLLVHLKQNGSNLTLPDGVSGYASIFKVNNDGSRDNSAPQGSGGSHNIFSDGTFPGRVYGHAAGRYQVNVDISGSATIPSFSAYIYQDANGKFSLTSGSGYSPNAATYGAPFTFDLTVPAPTLAVRVVNPGTTTGNGQGQIDICDSTGNNCNRYVSLDGSGLGYVNLPNGTYVLRVSDQSANYNSSKDYTITITGNAVSSIVSGGQSVSAVGGIYGLAPATPNLNVKVIDSISHATLQNYWANVWSYSGIDQGGHEIQTGDFQQNLSGYSDLDGQVHGSIPAGQYVIEIGTFYPDSGHGRKRFHLTVSSQGVPTVEGYSAINGAFTLPVEPANLKLLLTATNLFDASQTYYYDYCTGTDEFHIQNCEGNGFDQLGHSFGKLDAGTYYLRVHPQVSSAAVKTYSVTVDQSGAVTISGTQRNSDGFWLVDAAVPNVLFKAINPVTRSPLRDVWLRVEKYDSQNQVNGSLPNGDFDQNGSGLTSINVPNGHYRVTLVPNENTNAGLAEKSYELQVTNGVPTLTSGGSEVSKDGSNHYLITLNAANFPVQLQTPDGAPLTESWFDICTDTGNGPLRTGACFGSPWSGSTGQASISLDPGSYYIRVQPGSQFALASNIYHVTVASDHSVTIDGVSKSGDFWPLRALTPILSGSISDQNGNPLDMSLGQGIDLQVQMWNQNNRNWDYQSGQWRRSNVFGVNVTQPGKYRLMAFPQGFSGFTSTSTDPFWITSEGKISLTENGTGTTSISNFVLQLKAPNILVKVTDPRDGTPLSFGYINAFSVDTQTQNQMWVSNANINSNSPGLAGFNFVDGTYRLEVSPQQGNTLIPGLSRKNYQVRVSNNSSTVVVTPWGGSTPVATANSRYVLPVGAANITGRIVGSDGNNLPFISNSWININVQSLNRSGNWDWSNDWYQPDGDGYFNISVDTPGTYRLLLQPNSRPDAADTYSSQFTVTSDNASTFKREFGALTLNAPDLNVSVYEGETPTAITFLNIEVRQGNQWIGNYNTTNGVASISFPDAGSYDLILHPNGTQVQDGYAAKTYHVTVTKDGSGVKTALVTSDPGASKVANLNKLKLGEAALAGYVHLPSSGANAVVENSQVIATDMNGQDLWQYSSQTASNGKWAMSLPAGTYKIQARAPYGNGDYGNSNQLGIVTIGLDGNATLSGGLNGVNPKAINLELKDPTWKGVVLAPNGTDSVPFANICLVLNNVWSCTQANQDGAWSMSAPDGFNGFDASAQLRVEDARNRQYPSLIFNTASDVLSVLGLTNLNVRFQLPSPNLTVHVTAGSNPAQNIWVNLNQLNGPWLGANGTDLNGDAKFYIEPSLLSGSLTAMVDVNSNSNYSLNYASTNQTFTGGSVSIALSTPNLHGVVSDPGTDSVPAGPVPNTWVELFQSNGQGGMDWKGGSGTGSDGKFSLFAPAVNNAVTHYLVRVNPSGNSTSTSTSRMYDVTVDGSGNVTGVVVKDSNPAVIAPSTTINNILFYTMALASPSVQGNVLGVNDSPLANSWVETYDPIHNIWIDGANSHGLTGAFGMALNSGTYRLQANVPWNVTGSAKSAPCLITISGGAITSGDSSCVAQDTKRVTLKLRAPNITMTLKSGTEAMAYANVGIGYGNWNTNAQADSNGVISLFMDPDAIAAANPGVSGTIYPYIWVNPSNTAGDKMVQWNCSVGDQSKPICRNLTPVTIGATYPMATLGEIQVLKPNVTLQINRPGTSSNLGQGAWVSVISFLPDIHGGISNFTWAGASTDSNGIAHFYLDTSTATADTRWGVTVDAPWNQRDQYSTKSYGTYDASGDWSHGLTWDQLVGQSYSPALPNLKVTINRNDGVTPNRYGWVLIEELADNGNPMKGNGSGLDYNGKTSLLLGNSKHYRITAFPNGGEGAQTACLVDTDSSGVMSSPTNGCAAGVVTNPNDLTQRTLTVSLNLGNVTGTVKDNTGHGVSGAIVVASVPADNTVAQVTTSTNDAGRFGLQLDSTKVWSITILPPGTSLRNKTLTQSVTPPSSGATELGDIALEHN